MNAWEEGFLAGLRPEKSLTVSEWSDTYRILSSKASAEPGKWRTSRTPYLKEPASENPARKPEELGSPAVECPSCKHAFALSESKALQETGGRIVECP